MDINKNIRIKVSEKAKELLAEQGFDPNLGARPLKRVIQKKVLDPLALKIVTGLIKHGSYAIIDSEGDKISVKAPSELESIKFKQPAHIARS